MWYTLLGRILLGQFWTSTGSWYIQDFVYGCSGSFQHLVDIDSVTSSLNFVRCSFHHIHHNCIYELYVVTSLITQLFCSPYFWYKLYGVALCHLWRSHFITWLRNALQLANNLFLSNAEVVNCLLLLRQWWYRCSNPSHIYPIQYRCS